MDQKQQLSVWYFIIAFLVILAIQNFLVYGHVEHLPYSEFKTLLKAGKVKDVALGEQVISGTLAGEGLDGLVADKTAERLRQLGTGEHPFTTIRVNDPTLDRKSTRLN